MGFPLSSCTQEWLTDYKQSGSLRYLSYLALGGGGLEGKVVLLEGGSLLVGLVGVLVVLALVKHGCNNVQKGVAYRFHLRGSNRS